MKTYQTKEWRLLSRAYVADKPCEWCGRRDGDIVTVRRKGKEKRIKIHILPHHRVKVPLGLRVYKRLATAHFKDYFRKGANEKEYDELHSLARRDLIEGAEEKDIKKRLRYLWDLRHRDELDRLYEDYKKTAEAEYMNLTPETTIILCNRCHYARERGLILCKICETNYHKPNYSTCFECRRTPE